MATANKVKHPPPWHNVGEIAYPIGRLLRLGRAVRQAAATMLLYRPQHQIQLEVPTQEPLGTDRAGGYLPGP